MTMNACNQGQKIERDSGWEATATGNMTIEQGLVEVGRHNTNN